MTLDRTPFLTDAALTLATWARSLAAAEAVATWRSDETPWRLPYLDEAGTPLLVADREQTDRLLAAESGEITVRFTETGAALRLAGAFWPVSDAIAADLLRELRAWHAACTDCPESRATHLVGLQVERVRVRFRGRDRREQLVPLDAYHRAHADDLLVTGVRLAEHLGASHGPELRAASAALVGRSPGDILSASIEGIHATGIDLVVIDATQAHRVHQPFPHPATTPDDLVTHTLAWLDH